MRKSYFSNAREAVTWLNASKLFETPRTIRQPNNAPLGLGGWYLRIFSVIGVDLKFCECHIRDSAQYVGCPNPPETYLIWNKGKATLIRDYGRAVRFFASLVRASQCA